MVPSFTALSVEQQQQQKNVPKIKPKKPKFANDFKAKTQVSLKK